MLTINAIVVGLIIAQRLVELRISKRHHRELTASGAEDVGDPVFPWMVFTHALLLVGCLVEPWLLAREFHPWVGWPALAILLIAQTLRFWVLRSLGRHWNVRIVASGAGGVVTSGPYRFVRHPNYAVVLVEAIVLPLFHGAFLTLVVVQFLHIPVLIARIRAEERYLMSLKPYRDAMSDKPRFLPRLWTPSPKDAAKAVR
jgi:methyltransferase